MNENAVTEGTGKRRRHKGLKAILWTVLGLWLAVIVIMQVALNTKVLTRIVNRIADEFVDGSVDFSKVSASMVKSFPNLNVTIEDFSLTYPHDRFSQFDTLGCIRPFLLEKGRGYEVDTLAHFDKLDLSVNYMRLLSGRIRVPKAILERPRIFAHQYDSTAANWNMIKLGGKDEDKDTSIASIPSISIGKLRLDEKPIVIYTNQADTLSASMLLKKLTAKGRYNAKKGKIDKANLGIDSLFLAGRLPSDTVALALHHLGIKEHSGHLDIGVKSDIFLALRSAGRMKIPFSLDTEFSPDFDKKIFAIEDLKASLASIELKAEGLLDMSGRNPYIKANASIDEEPIDELIECFGDNFPILKKLHTDAKISLAADCYGEYDKDSKSLPPMSLHLEIPDAGIGWEGLDEKGRFDLEADAKSVDGLLKVEVPDLCFSIDGAKMTLNGGCSDLLAEDPSVSVDASLHAVLDSLVRFLPDSLGLQAHGNMDGDVEGSFLVSQLDIFNFEEIGVKADIKSDGISISIPKDTLYARLGRTTIELGPYSHTEHGTSTHAGEEHHHVGLTASIDSLAAEYGASTFIRGNKIALSAHNSEEVVDKEPGNHPLHAHLDIGSVGMMDLDSCFVGVRGSENVLKLTRRKRNGQAVPYLDLSSENSEIAVRQDVNRISAKGLNASISAHPEGSRSSKRRKHILDSLQKVYPGVPKDSLFSKAFRARGGAGIPDYMSEKDFAKKDINLQLGESIAKYIKEWQIAGNVKLGEGQFITPYYPIENKITGFSGKFTNDELNLTDLSVESGSSDIHASGTLSGLKRELTSGKGRLKLDLGINSDLIDLNEIFVAINQGKQFSNGKEKLVADISDDNDSDYLDAVKQQAAKDSVSTSTLIVIPANLEAKVSINANTVKYSSLETSWVSSDMEMKQRCLQLTNTMAMTNMGDVYVEGFYSTRTKKDLKAGFDLTFSNITAEKVIELFPAVDSIMPMLQAFKGLLDCEMAATADIDTSMNIVLPTINGMIKIDGKNLSLAESESLDKLRKTLMFKDKDSSNIDDMSVRGIIKENHLEIFPFILKVDRYTIALNGLQKFDQNFKYHVSAIKSPIPFRFGINLKGSFSKWGWKLGKAKYKSEEIPLFDEQVDGLKYNLLSAIHNIFNRGVEKAIQQNEQSQAAIEEKKSELEYSVEETEELSEEEKKQLESAGKEDPTEENKVGSAGNG